MSSHSPDRGKIRFGTFEADLASRELRRNGRKIRLQDQPFRLLALLLERPGEVITREEIQRRIWGDTFVDFEDGLHTAARKLRDALGDSSGNPRLWKRCPGAGTGSSPRYSSGERRPPAAMRRSVDAGYGPRWLGWRSRRPFSSGNAGALPKPGEHRLEFFDFTTGKSTTIADNLGETKGPLAVSADGRTILYSRQDATLDDLMLVENFR